MKTSLKEKLMGLLNKWNKLFTDKSKRKKPFWVTVKRQLYNKVNTLFLLKILLTILLITISQINLFLTRVFRTADWITLMTKVTLPTIPFLRMSLWKVFSSTIINSVNMEVRWVKSNPGVKNSRNKIKSVLAFNWWKMFSPSFKTFINWSITAINIGT